MFAQAAGAGSPQFASMQSGDFDAVNLQNLNVNFTIPIVAHRGRGLGFQFARTYNSNTWVPVKNGSATTWAFLAGFKFEVPGPGGFLQFTIQRLCFPLTTEYGNYVYTDSMGTSHPFQVGTGIGGTQSCDGSTPTGNATDASGYYIDISNLSAPFVRTADGTKISFNGPVGSGGGTLKATTMIDANGNQITSTTNSQTLETDWVDTLGQTVLKTTIQFNNPSGEISETDYNRLAVDGSYQTVAEKYQLFNVKTAFGCSGVNEFTSASDNVLLVSEVDLPNGQKYIFTYEPTPGASGYVTGRIQQVTLPTGGTITYEYTGANGGVNCSDGSLISMTRTISDGVAPATWSYSRNISNLTTTVTAPQLPYDSVSNQTVITFNGNKLETQRQSYQGGASGNPLRTVNTGWTTGPSNFTPVSRTTVLEDGITQSEVETSYDSNGILQTLKEHDWGQGSPGAVLRTTSFSYLPSTGSYAKLNMINRVTTKTVADSNGTVRSRDDITYDESVYLNGVCVSGASQHDDTDYGCSYTTRGLPTSVTTYTNPVNQSGGVTTNLSYDSVGNLRTMQIAGVQQKQWNFSAATQYAFPDSVVTGPVNSQLTSSATYNLATGQVATATDANGQITVFTYADPGHLDRLTNVKRPDNANLTTSYNDSSLTVTNSAPVQGSSVAQRITSFDGLGRPLTSTIEDANDLVYSIVKSQYDPIGRPYMSSNPYTSSPQFWTTQQFDALGRPTLTFLPDGSETSASYATNSVIGTSETSWRRSFTDGLGRLTEVDEPNPSSPGASATATVTIEGALNSSSSGDAARSGSALTSYLSSSNQMHVDYFDANNHVIDVAPNSNGAVQVQDITAQSGAPAAGSGSSMTSWIQPEPHVVYVNSSGHLQQIWDYVYTQDLTAMLGLPANAPTTALTNWMTSDGPYFVYVTTSGHLQEAWYSESGGAWHDQDLTTITGAALAASGSALTSWVQSDGPHVVYVNSSGHLQQIWNNAATQDLSAMLGLPTAAPGTPLTSWVQSDGPHFVYLTTSQHLQQVFYNVSQGTWYDQDLDGLSGGPAAATGSTLATYGNYAVVYQGGNGHIYQDWWSGSAWINNDLTANSGTGVVPASATALTSFIDSSGQHSAYLGANSHVYQLFWNGSSLANLDLSANGVLDSGTVTLEIDNFAATACFGPSTNSQCSGQPVNNDYAEVATALAQAINGAGSSATATANGNVLSLTWKTPGPFIPEVGALSTTHDQPGQFTSPSFTSQAVTFSGGSLGSSLPTTLYTYGVLDNLLQVTEGAQTRSYAYDGMGRMTDATTPEAGHVNYQYDSLSRTTQRTDARNVQANYQYDPLNRLTGIGYTIPQGSGVAAMPNVCTPANGQPANVCYAYGTNTSQNNNGRLLTMTDPTGSETYSYTVLGQTSQLQKVINGTAYTTGYGYNLAGEMTQITYPSGRVVQQSFDPIGRLCEIAPQTTACGSASSPFATAYGYNAASEGTGFTYGNGVIASIGYSPDRLQLTSLSYVKGSTTLFALNYFYHQDSQNCPTGAPANNGQIQCITDGVDSGRNLSYTYDALGRLAAAGTEGSANYPAWGLSFTDDRYGNLIAQNVTAGSGLPFSAPVDPTTNRINNGINTYDATGNMTFDGNNTLVYDGESREVSSTQSSVTSTYSYDCKGLRVVKSSGGTATVYIYSGSKVIAEYVNGAGVTTPTREYIYSGEGLLAKIEGGATNYYHTDHLSVRALTDINGNVSGQQGHFPYGQVWYDGLTTNEWKYTAYQRDAESQNDYALARYYVNRLGRFPSPDPLGGSAGNPQSWNRYTYSGNDPVNLTDPTGQFSPNWYISAMTVAAQQAGGDCTWDGIDGSCQAIGNMLQSAINVFQSVTYGQGDIVDPDMRIGPDGEWQVFYPGVRTDVFPNPLFDPNDPKCTNGDGSDCHPLVMRITNGGWGDSAMPPVVYSPQSHGMFPAVYHDAYIPNVVPRRGVVTRLFGTHWCGPGGAGSEVNSLDAGCHAHDNCYDDHNLSLWDNFFSLSPDKQGAMQACNQALCDAARGSNDPGAGRVEWYFTHVPALGNNCGYHSPTIFSFQAPI